MDELKSYIEEYKELYGRETSEESKAYDAGVLHGLLIGLRILKQTIAEYED